MTDASTSPVAVRDAEIRAEGAPAALDAAGWLGFAAAPTFALTALWIGLSGGRPDMLCMPMRHASPLDGMAAMYLLMSVFHAAPWLKAIARRRRRRRFPVVSCVRRSP